MNRGEDDLDKLERETRKNAAKQVAAMLQPLFVKRPDQLEKVETLQKRQMRKKAAADALLKSAVQSQLDGVKNGLDQLRECLQDIKTVKENIKDVHETYNSVSGLREKLAELQKESIQHNQLALAVESLKHISSVPDLVAKTDDCIKNGKILHAHRHIADLEASRDQLMLELHKQGQQDSKDGKMIQGYFSGVEELSFKLFKQVKLSLERLLTVIRQEPTQIATAMRIIAREERMDQDWEKRYDQIGYKPTDRPKEWKKKMFEVFGDSIDQRIEANQLEDRQDHKMWLVRHLELIRRNTIDDLKVVKSLCEPCFPREYEIVKRYVKLYHTAISQHILTLKRNGLEGNEIVSLLTWCSAYFGPDMMGHRGLNIEEDDLGPILSTDDIEELQQQYIQTLRNNITMWMSNAISTDMKDWYSELDPEKDGKGYSITQLPVILFQIVEQNLQVAQIVGSGVTPMVLNLCLDEISIFANTYSEKLKDYKEAHLKERSQPRFYLQYMVANVNNCDTLSDLTTQLKKKYGDENDGTSVPVYGSSKTDRYNIITEQFIKVAMNGCLYLKEEVFLDLGQFLNNILTRSWLDSENDVDTVCMTVEDYCQDFRHLRPSHFNHLLMLISELIMVAYLRQLLSPSRKITFKSSEERIRAGEKIIIESERLHRTFKTISATFTPSDEYGKVLPALAEILKMQDTSMMSLEICTLIGAFPDVKPEQLVNLLQLRSDMGKSDATQLVNDMTKDRPTEPVRKGILSRV